MKFSRSTVQAFFPEAIANQGRRREWRVNCLRLHKSRKTGRMKRDDGRHLYLNFEKGYFHCFQCSFAGKLDYLARVLGTEAELPTLGARFTPTKKIKQVDYKLPKSYRQFEKGMKSRFGKQALNYVLDRGVTWEQIRRHRIGFATRDIVANSIILPFIEAGALIYWQARYFLKQERRYYFPTGSREGIMFNWDVARRFDKIILVEGVFDALSVGDCALAFLNKEMGRSTFRKLKRLEGKEFVVMLDEGEEQDALGIAEKLLKLDIPVSVAFLPEGTDPGVLSRREIEFYIASAEEIDLSSLIKHNVAVSMHLA